MRPPPFLTLAKGHAGRRLDGGNWRRQTWWTTVDSATFDDMEGQRLFVPHYPPHSMRHTCASWLVQKGVSTRSSTSWAARAFRPRSGTHTFSGTRTSRPRRLAAPGDSLGHCFVAERPASSWLGVTYWPRSQCSAALILRPSERARRDAHLTLTPRESTAQIPKKPPELRLLDRHGIALDSDDASRGVRGDPGAG